MSTRRVNLRLMGKLGAALLLAGLILAAIPQSAGAEDPPPVKKGRDPYVALTGEFWEAMEKMSRAGATTYGDRQEPLLEQIAVASQFMVKTNLTLIKQNDRIIQLLEELNRKRLIQER